MAFKESVQKFTAKTIAYCDALGCGKVLEAGEFAYSCAECKVPVDGKELFMLVCHSCCSTGVGCRDNTHVMKRTQFV